MLLAKISVAAAEAARALRPVGGTVQNYGSELRRPHQADDDHPPRANR